MIFFIIYVFCCAIGALIGFQIQQTPLVSLNLDTGKDPSISSAIENAPHIFNTINGAMRQWGPSLKHNGMSFFPVTIPENTILYHGNISDSIIDEIGWLAFEVEHSEFFLGVPPIVPGMVPTYPSPDPGNKMLSPESDDKKPSTGYLSTYRISHTLRNILYLDGQSAAKSTFGTLDTQDKLLLKDIRFRELPGFQDYNRVTSLCSLWPHLDGIIRMEVGFELILCRTSESVQLVSMTSRPARWTKERKVEDKFWNEEFMRAVSLGYHGVGAGKVLIDYSSMVSAYFYPLNLTNPDPEMAPLPRLPFNDIEGLDRLRNDVIKIFDGRERAQSNIDWQAITDSIVSRYSDRLAYMKSLKSNRMQMLFETNVLLERFIDYKIQDLTAANQLCKSEYLLPIGKRPTILADELIYEAITEVSGKICSVLLEARKKLIEQEDGNVADEVKNMIGELMKWLDWSSWLECGKCDSDEVCVVAIWPWGTKENHVHPRCYDLSEAWGGLGYWDYDIGPLPKFN